MGTSRDLAQVLGGTGKRSGHCATRHAISASSACPEPFRSDETQPRQIGGYVCGWPRRLDHAP